MFAFHKQLSFASFDFPVCYLKYFFNFMSLVDRFHIIYICLFLVALMQYRLFSLSR